MTKRKFPLGNKGHAFVGSVMNLLIGLILITAFLPLINELVYTSNASNMAALSFSSIITLLVGMVGLLFILLFIMGIVRDFQGGGQQQVYYPPQ